MKKQFNEYMEIEAPIQLKVLFHEMNESQAIMLQECFHAFAQKVVSDVQSENGKLPIPHSSTDDEEPIDIYAPEGTKVKYTGRGGYDHHKEHANKHLKVDEIYTIDHTDVGGWHTDVYLKEVPNEAFNSVHFVNAE